MGYFRPLSQTKFINDANLVSYWKLDGNSNDEKGLANGTDTNITYSTFNFGQGAGPTGTNAPDITVTNTAYNVTTGNATWSFWVNSSSYPDPDNFAPFFLGGGYRVSGYYAEISNTGILRFISNQSGANQAVATSTGVISTNTTYFCTFTKSGTTISIYVNGNFITSGTITNPTTGGNNLVLLNYGASKIYRGPAIIDDFSFFSRALSAGEIAELYQSMTLGEYLPNSSTKLLLHLNGSSADSSGNNNNGVDTAITYSQANGKFGQGAGFNGSSSIISTNTSIDIGTGDFTVSGFINLDTIKAYNNYIFTKSNDTNPLPLFQIYVTPAGYLEFNGRLTGSYTTYKVTSPSTLSTGQWYNFQIVRSGSNGYLYINGNLVASNTSTFTSSSFNQSSYPLTLGAKSSGYGAEQFYDGNIDEIFYENRAWSASEVRKYYTYTKGRFGII